MYNEIAIVCQCPEECEIYTREAGIITKESNKKITVIPNPAPDKNRYNSVIFVFRQCPSNDCTMLNSWIGHQHIKCVSGDTAKDRLENFAMVFRHICGIPLPLETERKFLIKYPPIHLLDNMPNCARADITQVYLNMPGANVRLRKRTVDGVCSYIKTEKSRLSDLTRIESERQITAEEYDRLMQFEHPDTKPIVKSRYCLMYNGQYLEIDVFPFWNDKAYLEAELISEDEQVELPPFLEIIKEVTTDKRYTNKSLAMLLHNNKIHEL